MRTFKNKQGYEFIFYDKNTEVPIIYPQVERLKEMFGMRDNFKSVLYDGLITTLYDRLELGNNKVAQIERALSFLVVRHNIKESKVRITK